ncbi:MAG TPA: cache domain-containing protein, partial [Candidatus Acidoferrales bacterium]|nr:cache domain-containing protein [Candidatus Acidoferrales bacterium]
MSTDFAKLRFWLLGLVLLVIFPSMIFLIFEAAWEQRNDARLQAQQTALRVAQLAAMEQERLITGAHHLLMTLAELPEVRETRADACNKLFAAVMKKFPYYTNVAAATPRGEIFCSGLPNHPTINIADRAYFQAALKERQLGISHVLLGRMSGKPNISMAYPSFDSDGPVHAVVFVGLDLGWLNFMATKAQMPPQSVLVAMDEKGTIFARYPDPEKWLGKSVDHELARTILERKEGVTEAEGLDGVRRLYGFTTLHRGSNGEALFVRVGIPNEVAFASSDRIFYRSLMFLLVVSLLAAAGTWFGTHLLVRRRLDALVTAARELGDVEIQKTRSAAPELAKIPVGQYGEVVDEMWSSLQRVATRQADIAAMIAHDLRNPIQT